MRISDWSSDVCSSDLVVFALRGETVEPGAVQVALLRIRDIGGLAAPQLERQRLQRATIGEGQRPGQVRMARVHGTEMRRGKLVRLAARQEGDAWHGARPAPQQHLDGGIGDLAAAGLFFCPKIRRGSWRT